MYYVHACVWCKKCCESSVRWFVRRVSERERLSLCTHAFVCSCRCMDRLAACNVNNVTWKQLIKRLG